MLFKREQLVGAASNNLLRRAVLGFRWCIIFDNLPPVYRTSPLLLLAATIGVGAFLYNKHLNLETAKERRAYEAWLFERERKCAADGTSWSMEYLREEQSSAYEFHLAAWDPPQFHYSVEREACLVRTRSVDFRDDLITYEHLRVTDISGNRPVLESSVKLVPDTSRNGAPPKEEFSSIVMTMTENLSRAEFGKQADAIMRK